MTKTVLITGGARGIGRAIAAAFASDHNVAITWNSTKPNALPKGVHAIPSDLTQPDSCTKVIAKIIDHFGALDVIVNNAGAIQNTLKENFDAPAYRAILDVNLLVPADLLAAALPYLKPGASLVNISSVNAVLPPRDAAIYGASKAALNLWTRAMAKELGAQGIRVNAVAPGAINIPEEPRPSELTQIFVKDTSLCRLATADDIADAVRFLASDQARSITGEVLTVSGGYKL